jgi:NAD(P)-dependent dehydrogenase (short-subunit alcohol dehydrogenase family)
MTSMAQRQIALITGASRGLGLALARELAGSGVRVAMVARDAREIEAAAEALRAEGHDAIAIADDVGDPDAAWRIAGQVHALLGTPDVVIHNASALGPVPLAALADTAPATFAATFATNVFGPFALTRALVGAMVLRGWGTFVFISSDAAVEAYPTWGAYGASKAALDHLGRIWAAELEGTGVRVVAIDPGEMDTRMHADAVPDADRSALASPDDVARRIVDGLRGVPSGARVSAAGLGVTAGLEAAAPAGLEEAV